jgi:hypothetical protein
MSWTLALGIAGLVVTIIELLRTGWQIMKIGWKGWINILITTGAPQRTPEDVSLQFIPPPPSAKKSIDILRGLGFRRVGEAQIKMPSRPVATVWVMTSEDTTVQGQVIHNAIELSSFFGEKAMLVTNFPFGEHINAPHYQARTIITGIPDAYQYHLRQVDRFRRKHGPPHPIINMQQYLHWEMIGRTLYAPLKLRRAQWRNIVLLLAFFYGVLALILIPLVIDPKWLEFLPSISFQLPQEKILTLMVLATLPVVEAARAFYRRSMFRARIDSRSKPPDR